MKRTSNFYNLQELENESCHVRKIRRTPKSSHIWDYGSFELAFHKPLMTSRKGLASHFELTHYEFSMASRKGSPSSKCVAVGVFQETNEATRPFEITGEFDALSNCDLRSRSKLREIVDSHLAIAHFSSLTVCGSSAFVHSEALSPVVRANPRG